MGLSYYSMFADKTRAPCHKAAGAEQNALGHEHSRSRLRPEK